MSLSDFFKKKTEKEEFDPIKDLVLSKLKVGYLVDYDGKTLEVCAYNIYDWDNEFTEEWELKGSDAKGQDNIISLVMEKYDSQLIWLLSSKVALSNIDRSILEIIKRDEDPPTEITYKTKKYFLAQTSAGYFLKDGKGDGVELITWDYEDEEEENFITLKQWGEDEFELYEGKFVKEYEFTNILPRNIN
ncbi:MAG: DUF4178 domain-containing protein [Nitrospirae bacterium]|nr:DUF4178 domain-containing protein [Nitrospirota bacterium]MBF0541622.1 DUF4178 domain-containing protein [Nitrospirota bacterium]